MFCHFLYSSAKNIELQFDTYGHILDIFMVILTLRVDTIANMVSDAIHYMIILYREHHRYRIF